MRRHRCIEPPAFEPLDTDAVKRHLRIDHDADDALLETLIQTAREQAESYTGRALIQQTWQLTDDAPANPLLLPRWPVLSVLSVTDSGIATEAYTVAAGDDAEIRADSGWGGPVAVSYTAGYGEDPASVPAPLRQWMLLQIGQWYEHREAVALAGGATPQALPFVDNLLTPYRIHWLGLPA